MIAARAGDSAAKNPGRRTWNQASAPRPDPRPESSGFSAGSDSVFGDTEGAALKASATHMRNLSAFFSEAGSTSNIYSQGLEPTAQLHSENRALREENRSLQAQLSHLSRGG